MTTETGADSEAKQPQKNKETEKGKAEAAEPTSPQNQPEQLPAAAGHSTPARKEQVSFLITAATKKEDSADPHDGLSSPKIFTFEHAFLYNSSSVQNTRGLFL